MSDNTRDLSQFGNIEREEASKLLLAMSNRHWASDDDELQDGVAIEFNPNSGNVFLVDDDCNVAMLNNEGELENWISCRACDNEDFRSEITLDENGYCEDCGTTDKPENCQKCGKDMPDGAEMIDGVDKTRMCEECWNK